MKAIFLLFILLSSFIFSKDIVIATGSKTGNYYQVGLELNKQWYDGKAQVINTQGSVENILLVSEKKADIALTQADALEFINIFYQATGKKTDDMIKIINEAYVETLHIIVSKKSNIKTLEDLRGKVMVCGGKKSGSSVTAGYIEQNFNLEFSEVLDVSTDKGLELLTKGRVDVVFYVTKAPSNLLLKYKNQIRLLEVDKTVANNKHIEVIDLPKITYEFMRSDIKTYGIKTYIIGQADDNEGNKKAVDFSSGQFYNLKLSTDILKKFNVEYGNQALLRINLFNEMLNELQEKKTLEKLIRVNDLVNKFHYLRDVDHWRKPNYWSNPLEFIGTGYADSEEFALLKYLFLVKLGVDSKKFKFISLDKPIKLPKNKTDYENIVLAYMHKPDVPLVILETKKGNPKLYLLKDQFNYKVIKKAPNKLWQKIFKENFSSQDADRIIGEF